MSDTLREALEKAVARYRQWQEIYPASYIDKFFQLYDHELKSLMQAALSLPAEGGGARYVYECLTCDDRRENVSSEEAIVLCSQHTNRTKAYGNIGFSGHATSFKPMTLASKPETGTAPAQCGHRFLARGSRALGIRDEYLEPACELPKGHTGQHKAGNAQWGEPAPPALLREGQEAARAFANEHCYFPWTDEKTTALAKWRDEAVKQARVEVLEEVSKKWNSLDGNPFTFVAWFNEYRTQCLADLREKVGGA